MIASSQQFFLWKQVILSQCTFTGQIILTDGALLTLGMFEIDGVEDGTLEGLIVGVRVCSGEKKTKGGQNSVVETIIKCILKTILLTTRFYSFASAFTPFASFAALAALASFAAFVAFVHTLAVAPTAGIISKEVIWVSSELGIINIHPHGHVHMIVHRHSSGHVEGAVAIVVGVAIAVPRTRNIRGAQPNTISDSTSDTTSTASPVITKKLSVSCSGVSVCFAIIVVIVLELPLSAHTACCASEQNTGYESRCCYLHGSPVCRTNGLLDTIWFASSSGYRRNAGATTLSKQE